MSLTMDQRLTGAEMRAEAYRKQAEDLAKALRHLLDSAVFMDVITGTKLIQAALAKYEGTDSRRESNGR